MRHEKRWTPLSLLLVSTLAVGCGDGGSEEAAPPQSSGAPAQQPASGAPRAAPMGALPPEVTQEMVDEGRQIFAGNGICFTCHGQDAQGTALAPSLSDGEWLWIETDQDVYGQLVTVIRTGVSRPKEYPAPMPPMGGAQLSEEQVRSVAAYVYSLNPQG